MIDTVYTPRKDRRARSTKAPPRAWLGLGVLGLTSLVVSMDLFVLLALPQIA